MDWKPRTIDAAEHRAVADIGATAFGIAPRASDDVVGYIETALEPERTFVVYDGATLAGTGASYSFELAIPGGAVPMAGVTWVATLPTYRRRGVLNAIMGSLRDQARERGEPLAGLRASEATIYRRYGFGVATLGQTVLVDTARATSLASSAAAAPGRLRLLGEDEAKDVLPTVWAGHWPRLPGEVSRNPSWWEAAALDVDWDREGTGRRFLVLHETSDGEPDGFAAYRIKENAAPGGEYHELRVDNVAGARDTVEASLVRYLLDVDLVRQVQWGTAPVDLPLTWQLADQGAVKVTAQFGNLWLRLLDIDRCLAERSYAGEGGAVLDVVDDGGQPGTGGSLVLDVGPEGAACRPTTREPDVRLGIAELGSLYLGGVSWTTLLRAGLVEELRPGTVHRLDELFTMGRAPHCSTSF